MKGWQLDRLGGRLRFNDLPLPEVRPGSVLVRVEASVLMTYIGSHPAERDTDLLYFSLITLSTIGYGDVVPLGGEARILAALEGVTGVLYIAITVALLVSRFRTEPSDSPDLTN